MTSPLPAQTSQHAARAGRHACARRRGDERGLTLIEITIAIAIVAVLFAAVVMGVGGVTGAKAKKSAGELAGTIRSLYDEAALSSRTCRLVFKLPDEKVEGGQVEVRAECAERALTSSRDRDEEIEQANEDERDRERGFDPTERREDRDFTLSDAPSLDDILKSEEDRVAKAAAYSEFTSPVVEPVKIPEDVRIWVWTKNQKEAVKEGLAYLYFYPQGYTERAMVFVTQGDNAWTIKVSPLTGTAEIVPELLEVPR